MKLSALISILAGLMACGVAGDETQQVPNRRNPVVENAKQSPTKPLNAPMSKVSSSEAVKVHAAGVNIRAGGIAEAAVKVLIADGYHINANPASFAYLQPTALKIEKTAVLTIGKPVYQKGALKKFSFSEESISVYERTALIKLQIKVDKDARPGRVVLRGTVRSQPCNDNACFPARTIGFSLPVQINR